MKKKTQLIIKIALAVFSVFLLVSVVVLKIQVDELEKQKNELTAIAEKNKEELEELKYKLTLSEMEYIERYVNATKNSFIMTRGMKFPIYVKGDIE